MSYRRLAIAISKRSVISCALSERSISRPRRSPTFQDMVKISIRGCRLVVGDFEQDRIVPLPFTASQVPTILGPQHLNADENLHLCYLEDALAKYSTPTVCILCAPSSNNSHLQTFCKSEFASVACLAWANLRKAHASVDETPV